MYNYFVVIFKDWIDEKFKQWSKEHGNKSENQFAIWLEVSQSSVNAWRSGARGTPRSPEVINKLANKFGNEVYVVLGLPVPPSIPPGLPPSFRALLLAATRELADTLAENKIDPASPEGEALAVSVMARHGYKRIDTTSPGKSG